MKPIRPSALAIASIGLNVALAAAVIWLLRPQERQPAVGPAQVASVHPANSARASAVPEAPVSGKAAASLTWAALESPDYKQFIKNLRAFGCPEETIRDIIVADIHKLYARKRAALSKPEPFKFWQPEPERGAAAARESRKQWRALQDEEQSVLAELFGASWKADIARADADPVEDERFFGPLPADKREKVRALVDRFGEAEADVYFRMAGGELSADDKKRLREIKQQERRELAALLTPAELEEYDVRNSETAERIRGALLGQDWSKEEFLAVFRLQKTFDDRFEDSSGKASAELKAAAAQLESQLKGVLGEQRYAEYSRGQSEDYQELSRLVESFNLPATTAAKVYSVQGLARDQLDALGRDTSLAPEQLARTRAAIEQERDKTIQALLGDTAFKVFQKRLAQ
jgi:hypothetical protein